MLYKKTIPLDVDHFVLQSQDTGDWKEKTTTQEQILNLLSEKIKSVDFECKRRCSSIYSG